MIHQTRRFYIPAFLAILLVCALSALWKAPELRPPLSTDKLAGCPGIVLWAWERPEDLQYLDPNRAGVAFLACTVHMRGVDVIPRPRLQPLKLPPAAYRIAVVRIESDRLSPPALSSRQLKAVSRAIIEVARSPFVRAVQVDFDAKQGERKFYRALLYDIHRQLPPAVGLSLTALASWCTGDCWLAGLPVDEVVPMLFRMGADREHVLVQLQSGRGFAPTPGLVAVGVATDEPETGEALASSSTGILDRIRRIYVFSPKRWSAEAVTATLAEVQQWQQRL